MLFDEHGRCLPQDLNAAAYENSRRYFLCEPREINTEQIYDRCTRHLGEVADVTATDFAARVADILSSLTGQAQTSNMPNGTFTPFIIPADSNLDDIGQALDDKYLTAVNSAFVEQRPASEFNVEVSALAGKLSIKAGSRHEQLIEKLRGESVVGVYFPCMTEYSVPAAIEQISNLPDQCLLTGAVDLCAAMVATPDLLIRDQGYPPTFWATAIEGEHENIGYHFESYGYNLKFYRRSHLGQAAEYWWQGVTVLG